ncbi:phosphate butyryltransferase [Bacillus lacus]|uniref:Phosphate butyryltransferase n=1 Tax=Metabacillus lacus TaxID=1983721 RepID=A0A7X2J0K9_9BACI|nr:phosphate butyryltransferase [Metabacillus lacus]MRX73150.1 phosphate butyryltransferase [Metabacillus lacus]
MTLTDLLIKAAALPKRTIAVAAAEDEEVMSAVAQGIEKELAHFILFGNQTAIANLMKKEGVPAEKVSVVHADHPAAAAELAVKAVAQKEAEVLMKGNVATAVILKAVLNKEFGLRTGRVLSHTAVFEIPGYERLITITDAAMNIEPDLQQKVQIIQNAVEVAVSIGITTPKVAPLAAVEVVNPSMQATLDAAALSQMNARGQIQHCIVDGPLALDNAISPAAAKHKGIDGRVAGQADILLVPNIETGNALYKSLIYFAQAKVGAVISGAKAPIVLTSRADTAESKLFSLALAICSTEK